MHTRYMSTQFMNVSVVSNSDYSYYKMASIACITKHHFANFRTYPIRNWIFVYGENGFLEKKKQEQNGVIKPIDSNVRLIRSVDGSLFQCSSERLLLSILHIPRRDIRQSDCVLLLIYCTKICVREQKRLRMIYTVLRSIRLIKKGKIVINIQISNRHLQSTKFAICQ